MLSEEEKADLLKRATAQKTLLIPCEDMADVRKYLQSEGLYIQEKMQRGCKVEMTVYSHLRREIHLLTGTAYLILPKGYTAEDCEIILRFLDQMKSKLER